LVLDVSLDGGRQELVTEVLVSRDSTEGVRKVATWQRKLLHEKCYQGFLMLSSMVVNIFTCNYTSDLHARPRWCCYEIVTRNDPPAHNLLREEEFRPFRFCYQPGTGRTRSAAEWSLGSFIRALAETVWSGLNDVLTEGLCLDGEVRGIRRHGRRPDGSWSGGRGVTRV
jgi:hypothetical protein